MITIFEQELAPALDRKIVDVAYLNTSIRYGCMVMNIIEAGEKKKKKIRASLLFIHFYQLLLKYSYHPKKKTGWNVMAEGYKYQNKHPYNSTKYVCIF